MIKTLRTKDGTEVKVNTRRVESTHLEWIGWPVSGEPLLLVQFKDGSGYGYLGASRQRAVAAAYAPSAGRYLHSRVKPRYKAVRLW